MNVSFASIAKTKNRLGAVLLLSFIQFLTVATNLQSLAAQPSIVAARFTPPQPPGRGAPGTGGAGGSRGCSSDTKPLTALVPSFETTQSQRQGDAVSVNNVWGLTTVEHPTFWFYVPYINPSTTIEFILKDEQGTTTVYRTAVKLPSEPGLIAVHLPSSAAPLNPNQMYHWFLKVRFTCEPNQFSELDFVEGWVQRVTPSAALAAQLKQTPLRQRANLYAENGIWFDALAAFAELRLANPNDATLITDWNELLSSVGLNQIANQPLIK